MNNNGRYVLHVIKQIRVDTDNEDYSATNGITDQTFLSHLNDAQSRFQSIISAEYPKVFRRSKEIQMEANEDTYYINDNVLLGNRILGVDYSPTGLTRDFYPIRQVSMHERYSDTSPDPYAYIRAHDSIIMVPVPSSAIGKIRVTYEFSALNLSTRIAQVDGAKTGTVTSIAYDNGTSRMTELTDGDYISIVDSKGNVLTSNIPLAGTGTGSASGTIAIDNRLLLTGETIPDNSYIVEGKYASTHSQFPLECEGALRKYVEAMILDIDESDKASKKLREAEKLMEEKAELYADIDLDSSGVRIVDPYSVV